MIEDESHTLFYAIPDLGDGVKAAIHHAGATVTTENVSRVVDESDRDPVRRLASRFLPGLGTEIRESAVCLYTNTPSHDFLLDRVPAHDDVILVSACSGHGFKFASAIGEIAAGLVLHEEPVVDITRFSFAAIERARAT
jgi:sarcosine oxidase